jgi:glutaredoxin|tara:strand:- start:470 stop:799 length:330 start_codon:yes stop_codon:yes gene_type:complete
MDKSNLQIKNLLEEIKDNSNKKVLVYALDGCPACIELKNKLDKVGVVFETVDMGGNQDMWDKLAKMGGSEYAPQVKVEDHLIKENEYTNVNQLVSCTLTNLLNRKIVIK